MANIALQLNVLNATLPELRGEMEDGLRTKSDYMNWFNDQCKATNYEGERIWRNVETKYTMAATAIVDGTERLGYRVMPNVPLQKQVGGANGQSTARLIYTLAVPQRDLISIKNAKGALQFYETLPERGLFDPPKELEKFILTGKVLGNVAKLSDMSQFMSLSPTWTGGIYSGLENGVLDAAPPASQTKSVLNLNKSASYRHVNQYGAINSCAAEYKRMLIQLYNLAGYQYADENRAPKTFWCDRTTYANYAETRTGRVTVSTVKDDTGQGDDDGMPIDGVKGGLVRPTWAVLPAVDFAGTPLENGWTMGLDTTTLERTVIEELSVGEWKPLHGTDMVVMEMIQHERYVLWELGACILIAGGNRM